MSWLLMEWDASPLFKLPQPALFFQPTAQLGNASGPVFQIQHSPFALMTILGSLFQNSTPPTIKNIPLLSGLNVEIRWRR